MKSHVTPQNQCSACKYVFDRASSLTGDHQPEADDFTLCLKWGATLRFNADLSTREATPAELESLDLDTYAEIQRLRTAILRLDRGSR